MQGLWETNDREYRRLILDSLPRGSELRLLDVGCADGAWTAEIASAVGTDRVFGIEVTEVDRLVALEHGIDVRAGDLEQPWPFDDGTIDVVHANQVIEHVKRLDHFVGEIRRVLAPGGTTLACTENLASWHNVGAAALGYMPFSLTNISAKGPVGNPFALHMGEPGQADSWQHIHVLTLDALVGIFEMHNFRVTCTFGAGYYPAFGRFARSLARWDPRHAHFIGVVAQPVS
jgi:SAM-dependent methyltransferase